MWMLWRRLMRWKANRRHKRRTALVRAALSQAGAQAQAMEGRGRKRKTCAVI